jgi:two-component system, OmpR family, response regulator VicR
MTLADEPADALDRLLDRLQHHDPDIGARQASVDPDTAKVVQELYLLATATSVLEGFTRELENRLALEPERLITGQANRPAGTLLGTTGQGESRLVDAGEDEQAASSRTASSPVIVDFAGEAQQEPPSGGPQSLGTRRGPIKILIVDDDRELVELLAFALYRAGLEPLRAHDGSTALRLFKEQQPSMVVLDINLGSSNGLEVLRQLRRESEVLVIMLTAADSEEDKVRGLEMGADDYLTKPFSHRELIARIRAQLRRSGQEWQPQTRTPTMRLQVGSITLDTGEHSVTKAGQQVSLTVTEFRLLHCLMSNAGAVVPTATLLKQVWGYADPGGSDVVRVTVHRLRRKLEQDPMRPTLLHTIPGVGVLLKPNPEPPSASATGR